MQREKEMSRKPKGVGGLRPAHKGNGVPASAPRRPEAALAERIFGWTIDGEELEGRLVAWQRRGSIGFGWLLQGWIAGLAGAVAALDKDDWCFPGARESRVALWRGLAPAAYLAQLLGREGPGGAGRTLPGMISDAEHRVGSVSGGPAAHLPHAVGAALAARHLGRKECAVALAGSGAIDSPDFAVACNFAAVFRAPAVFLIRGGPEYAPGSIAARARAYAMPGETLEAGDALGVSARVAAALARGRAGAGPTLLELSPPRDEAEAMAALRKRLSELGAWSQAGEQRDRAAAGQRWDRAFAEAEAVPGPRLETLTDNVFASEERHLVAQRAALLGGPDEIRDAALDEPVIP